MISASQNQIYLYIKHYQMRHGQGPKIRDVHHQLGACQTFVHDVNRLKLLHLLREQTKQQRLVPSDIITLPQPSVPIVGKIAAGKPIEKVDDNRTINLANCILGPNRFALEVKGDSMSGDNICDGDYIICEKCTTADENNIFVVLIDNQEVTLKRMKCNNDNTVTLIPSNPRAKCMVYTAAQVKVQGVYRGLLRLPD